MCDEMIDLQSTNLKEKMVKHHEGIGYPKSSLSYKALQVFRNAEQK